MSELLKQARITPEGIKAMRDKIGMILRSRNTYNYSSCYDSVRHFCIGIGDDNPLYIDREYGGKTKLGVNIAPPSFLYTVGITVVQMGLPGVHGFQAGGDWQFFKPIVQDKDVRLHVWLDDVVERPSRMGGRTAIAYYSNLFYTPDDTLLGYCRSWTYRIERGAARERGKESATFKPQKWTPDKIKEIEDIYDQEKPRGAVPRYWEDVKVGDALDSIVKGPLCLSDMIAFYAGAMVAPTPAHRLAHVDRKRHPNWWFRNPENGGLEPIVRVHENIEAATNAGVPAPYDVGVQRHSWLFHLVTNWMGDDGFLVSNHAEYRAFNYFGDALYFNGRVERKYEAEGEHRVDLAVEAKNQNDKISIIGTATVALPSRSETLTPVERRHRQPVSMRAFAKTLPVPPKF